MSRYADGIDSIRALAERFRGLTDLADVLSELGSLENAIVERKRQLEGVNADLAAAREAVGDAYAERDAVTAQQVQYAEEHAKACNALTEKARYAAEDIVKTAKRDADELRAVAARDAQRARDVHAEDMAGLSATKEAIEAEIRDAEARLDELNAQHEELHDKAERLREFARDVAERRK